MESNKKIEYTLVTADGKPVLSQSIELKPEERMRDELNLMFKGKCEISCTLSAEASEDLKRIAGGDRGMMCLFDLAFRYAMQTLVLAPTIADGNPVTLSRVRADGWMATVAKPHLVGNVTHGEGKTKVAALFHLLNRITKFRRKQEANADAVVFDALRLLAEENQDGKEDK